VKGRRKANSEIADDLYDHPRCESPVGKAIWPIEYRFQQIHDGGVWTSPDTFTADSFEALFRAVVAGFLTGSARWAIDRDGLILCGLDAQGNRYTRPEWPARSHYNLESIRAWHDARYQR
jgi:hypothetical protein